VKENEVTKYFAAIYDHPIGDIFVGVYYAKDINDVIDQIVKSKRFEFDSIEEGYEHLNEKLIVFEVDEHIGSILSAYTAKHKKTSDFCSEDECGNENFDAGFSSGVLWVLRMFKPSRPSTLTVKDLNDIA